jgi:hypothetical protein
MKRNSTAIGVKRSIASTLVEAILDGWPPEGVTLPKLMKPFPVEWQEHLLAIEKSSRFC